MLYCTWYKIEHLVQTWVLTVVQKEKVNPQDDASNKAGDAANENFDGNDTVYKIQ